MTLQYSLHAEIQASTCIGQGLILDSGGGGNTDHAHYDHTPFVGLVQLHWSIPLLQIHVLYPWAMTAMYYYKV